ncbi:MAG: protein O-mannosyl-transferase family [Pseudomonadota bacterium]
MTSISVTAERSRVLRAATAVLVLLFWLAYYAALLFPGLGGMLNAGDSAKFQTLGHSQIMVHGPGYPLVLLMSAGLRGLDLPVEPWRAMTFLQASVPGAVANALAFLIAERLTRSLTFGLAATLFLGSAGLMAVQSTEAEVYPLALAFVLSSVLLLILFTQTRRRGFFIAACAVYAISFGNHLMMIMLIPLFLWVTATHRDIVLRPRMIALVAVWILIGASQYLYLAWVAHDPATAYSEYLPLPPEPSELIGYISGTYFGDLYGSGLASTQTSEELVITLRAAHPWMSAPLILAGLALLAAGWRRRDAQRNGVALVLGAALCFLPFVLWYGAYDIRAFHLPVLGPLLVGSVAACGWWLGRWPRARGAVALGLVALGVWRAAAVGEALAAREPTYDSLPATLETLIAQAPVENPVVSMTYPLRMATLYHELLGETPRADYRVPWRVEEALAGREPIGGVVVPTDGEQLLRWVEHRHPGLSCRSWPLEQPEPVAWPAYAFLCDKAAGADAR